MAIKLLQWCFRLTEDAKLVMHYKETDNCCHWNLICCCHSNLAPNSTAFYLHDVLLHTHTTIQVATTTVAISLNYRPFMTILLCYSIDSQSFYFCHFFRDVTVIFAMHSHNLHFILHALYVVLSHVLPSVCDGMAGIQSIQILIILCM